MIKRIALSSILLALSVVSLFIGSIWPIKIAMCVMASAISAVSVIECGHKYAWLTFIGTSLLAFLLIPKKLIVYVYMLLLGYYPIIKLYIEKIGKLVPEWFLKLVIYNIAIVAGYFILNTTLLPTLDAKLVALIFKYLALFVASIEVLFVVFDLGLSYFIGFYNTRLRRNIRL